jgi:hypothetical protein
LVCLRMLLLFFFAFIVVSFVVAVSRFMGASLHKPFCESSNFF